MIRHGYYCEILWKVYSMYLDQDEAADKYILIFYSNNNLDIECHFACETLV